MSVLSLSENINFIVVPALSWFFPVQVNVFFQIKYLIQLNHYPNDYPLQI